MSTSSSDSEDDLPPVFLRVGTTSHQRGGCERQEKQTIKESRSISPIILSSTSGSSCSPPGHADASSTTCSQGSCDGLNKKRSHTGTGSDTVWSCDLDEPSTSNVVKRPRLQGRKKKEALQIEEDDRIEKKKQKALEKQKAADARKLDKEKKQAEKKQQNEMKKALKKASSETRKEVRGPAERVKQMIVVLERALVESAEFMTELTTELSALSVGYVVGCDDMPPGSVMWKRKITERTVDEKAKVIENTIEVEEKELLVTLEAQGLAGLVHCTKQVDKGIPLQEGARTLQQFVEDLQQEYQDMRISLAVEGMESFFRGNKTHLNRQFRNAIRSNKSAGPSSERLFSDVSSVDCMEALVGLQLTTNCVVRMFTNKQQLAEHVTVMTKALSEAHFRKENPFSFHVEAGQGASRQALRDTDNRVSLIWKHQLMQFNNISESMASAVVASWPSPAHLFKAYESCSDKKSAELLLQDVMIRRGVGVVASTRRFGPTHSKRIHTMMTSKDSKHILS